jgi:hypothetical protein
MRRLLGAQIASVLDDVGHGLHAEGNDVADELVVGSLLEGADGSHVRSPVLIHEARAHHGLDGLGHDRGCRGCSRQT